MIISNKTVQEYRYRTYLPLQGMEPLIPQVTVCSLQLKKRENVNGTIVLLMLHLIKPKTPANHSYGYERLENRPSVHLLEPFRVHGWLCVHEGLFFESFKRRWFHCGLDLLWKATLWKSSWKGTVFAFCMFKRCIYRLPRSLAHAKLKEPKHPGQTPRTVFTIMYSGRHQKSSIAIKF